jgi:hypothetical protein
VVTLARSGPVRHEEGPQDHQQIGIAVRTRSQGHAYPDWTIAEDQSPWSSETRGGLPGRSGRSRHRTAVGGAMLSGCPREMWSGERRGSSTRR